MKRWITAGVMITGVLAACVLVIGACASPAASTNGGASVPAGAERYELPDGHDGVIGGWTWCSHDVRLWQTYAWEDSTNGARVLALTSQPDGSCAR